MRVLFNIKIFYLAIIFHLLTIIEDTKLKSNNRLVNAYSYDIYDNAYLHKSMLFFI